MNKKGGSTSLHELHKDNPEEEEKIINKINSNKFQYEATNSIAAIEDYCKDGHINIGTMFYFIPIAPLRKFYNHVGIVTNIKEDGFEVCHLRKGLFIKYAEQVFVSFSDESINVFNFTRVKIFFGKKLSNEEIKNFHCRMEKLLQQPHIPYGLYYKKTLNCESLAFYIKTGKKTTSHQVIDFINKYGKVGHVAVSTFDMVMLITNKIGGILSYLKKK